MKTGLAGHVPHDATEDDTRSLTSKIFDSLRAEILLGELQPRMKLGASSLAARYGVSLSAVREALARLAAEGLLDAQDHRGYRVSDISRDDLIDLTRTRLDIECIALTRSIERGDAEWAGRVRAALAAMRAHRGSAGSSDPLAYRLHNDLHTTLVEACGSDWLLRLRKTLFERVERYKLLSLNYAEMRLGTEDEHDELVRAAAVERDAARACAVFTEHTMNTTQALLDAWIEPGLRGAMGGLSLPRPSLQVAR